MYMWHLCYEDVCLVDIDLTPLRRRRRPSAEERRLIVEEALEVGTSVARVARKHGVTANQVFACVNGD